ncbi:MAG: membrane protein insertase YidC [Bacteroidales bacterium]|nr:membrane protein insertase YidC [Bacteroidales bacterium]
MNKNTVIGTLLMCALLFGYMYYTQPSPEQIEAMRRYNDSIARVNAEKTAAEAAEAIAADALTEAEALPKDSAQIALLDSLNNAKLLQTYGALAEAVQGTEQKIVLENDVLRLTLSTKGGQIEEAVLKKYDDYQGDTLVVFTAENNDLYYTLNTPKGSFNTDRFYFEPTQVSDTSVTMSLRSSDGAEFSFVYALPAPDSYLVNYSIVTRNIENMLNDRTVLMNWHQSLPRTELGRDFEGRYSQIYYKYSGQSTDDLSSGKRDDETLDGRMSWISFQNQFFSTMFITNDLFTAGRLTSEPVKEEEDPSVIKRYAAENLEFELDTRAATQTVPMCFYIGPKDYYKLRDMNDLAASFIGKQNEDLDLQDSFYLGWRFIVHYINSWVIIPLFHLMDKFIHSYGIIILLMTLFIKLVTLPMTYKSYKSTARMRIANQMPEVQALNEKYPNQEDAMQKQQELMALYNKMGVSPAGGCLPMLIQWPVLIALFYFFPTSIELRHEPFLWADDLSTYDAFLTWDTHVPIFGNHLSLFCLLMTAVNIFYTWLMQKQTPTNQSMPGMKWMMYLMPLMFLFFLNNYSAGLSYYYFLSTLFGILITYGIRWSMNEDKILAEMKQNLKNPKKSKAGKKTSGWVARLQEIQKEQERQMKKQREEQQRKLRR